MDYSSLSNLIEALERGTRMHICVAFLGNFGNRKTRCTTGQTSHNQPVCLAAKKLPGGLERCYRCRMMVQKTVVHNQTPMAGLCINGVYEYCRPVIYENRVVCVIFIGNLLTGDPAQRKKLESWVGNGLLDTMEQSFTTEECARIADILESYISFLFTYYGIENKTFDPLVENIKSFIRENLSYDVSLEDLANVFHYSPKYMGRIFKQRAGLTIREYCNRAKISQAKLLLTETDLSVQDITLQIGFNSTAYFDRVFRKITGQSPQAYRSAAKKQTG